MASPDILQAQLQELEEQRNEALRDNDAALLREIDQEISNTRNLLRQSERRNEPANAQFVGQDPLSGAFRYQNRVTGEVFLSTRQPSASQQAAFDAANPPPAPQPAPPATASQTAQDDASKGPNATPSQEVGTDGRVTNRSSTGTATNADKPEVDQPGNAGETTGTNAPVKTGTQSQSINTNSNSGQAVPAPGPTNSATPGSASAPIQAGQSAQDDGAPANTTAAQAAVNATDPAAFKVITQPNVLDQFHNYTYTASVYLLTSDQYTRLLRTKNKRIDGYQLLFQSGGAANNAGGVRPPPAPSINAGFGPGVSEFGEDAPAAQPDGGRNPFFPDDFYIDGITITANLMGKGSGSSHMTRELKFTVVEPNGITLLDCLREAVFNAAPRGYDGTVNYTAAQYLMVIRFHGYDEAGKPVAPIKGSVTDRGGNQSDPTAVVEKFIPFGIKQINWSVGSKMVSYEWDCAPVDILVGGYTARGTIPYDVQLVDSSVGGLLGGDVAFAGAGGAGSATVNENDGSRDRAEFAKFARQGTRPSGPGFANTAGGAATGNPNLARQANRARNPSDPDGSIARAEAAKFGRQAAAAKAPAKADASPTGSSTNKITQGLCGAMNRFQAELVKKGIYTYPDNYSIRFEDGVDGTPGTEISGAKIQLPNTKVDKAKTASGASTAQAGGKALDPARNSVSNVTRVFSITAGMQMLQAIDLVVRNSTYISGQSLVTINADGTQEPRPENKNKKMKWYTVTMEASPTQQQDPLRNDFAYDITYVVRPFVLQNFESRYFPRSDFGGVHKSYPFWFTGENIAVLDYQETLNTLYQLTVSGGDPKATADKRTKDFVTSDLREILKYNYSPRSDQSSQGADGKEFEANANAAEMIYSPADLATAKVKIVGDPAWIAQGNLFVDLSNNAILQQVQSSGFEPDGSISFDTSDVMFEIVWQRPQDYDLATGLADPFSKTNTQAGRRGVQSRVYQAKTCVSEFRQGKFEQTLEGALKLFPIPGRTNTADTKKADAKNTDNQSPAEDARLRAANEKAKGRSSGLTDKQAQQARADFAARDPRRRDSVDGGLAAIQGAQQTAQRAQGLTSVTGSVPTSSAARGQQQLLNTVRPAGPPRPATSGGNSGSVAPASSNVGAAPPKMPSAGAGQSTLTPQQRRDVSNQQRSTPNSDPVSSSVPSNQLIVKNS